jgi:hypothetical protein
MISVDAEKDFGKIPYHCHIKGPKKLGTEETYLHIIRSVYDKPIANIILLGEKLKPFPLKSGMRQECTLFILIQHSIGIPSQRNKIKEKNKRNSDREGRIQTIPI